MVDIRQDTQDVKREFEGLSTPTQIFVWTLVSIGLLIGLVLGGAVGYGISVEEVEGRDCIEYEETLYCAEGDSA